MQKHELDILKTELGLNGIDNPDELRAAIQNRLSQMNALDALPCKCE